jgi:hypothetical protein
MRRPLQIIACVALVLAVAFFAQRVGRADVRGDVLRVLANGCAGDQGSRVGTGFAWHSAKEVVTALHVVAGCQRLSVFSERDQITYRVDLAHVLRRADLAIVQVQGTASFPPLIELADAPAANTDLVAWGYGEGIPAMRDFARLRVANGAPTLQQNLPVEVARELQRAGSPALDISVVPIDAPIAPGLSGAPLLDGSNRVRAIADGGVTHGITHVSWAIPVRYLTELSASRESLATFSAPNANLSAAEVARAEVFSADFVDPAAQTINCGTARLRKTRTRTLAEARMGNDSPMGLQQLESVFAAVGGAAPTLRFDVYEDAVSGATIALPPGAELVPLPTSSSCRSSLLGGLIDMVVSVTAIGPLSNPDLISSQFELFAATQPTIYWLPDAAWSYIFPFYRPDGLTVRRKAFSHLVPNQFNVATEYMFETLAARNGTFLANAAIRHADLALQLCQYGRLPAAQCPPPNYLQTWSQAALSVQLSTFAISAVNPNNSAWQQLLDAARRLR